MTTLLDEHQKSLLWCDTVNPSFQLNIKDLVPLLAQSLHRYLGLQWGCFLVSSFLRHDQNVVV